VDVTIIGGGWAGLAAAVRLSRHGFKVSVLEASRQLGGRARAVKFGQNHVDNGQHIMLGAYSQLLRLLEEIGVREKDVLKRISLDLKFGNSRNTYFHLRTFNLPSPSNLFFGLLGARGLNFIDRVAIIRAVLRMRLVNFRMAKDLPLKEYLYQSGQTSNTIDFLWEPLCISVLNTPIESASTELFLNVIRDAFFGKKSDSDMLLPLGHLNTFFPDPAMEYIEKHNGTISLATRVQSLKFRKNTLEGVQTKKGYIKTRKVVLATSPEQAYVLMRDCGQLEKIASRIGKLRSLPISTLYLRYPRSVSLGRDFIGFQGCHTQWLFDREKLTGDSGVLAAVISGPGEHMAMSVEKLTKLLINEIAEQYPELPHPVETKLIREKLATIASSAGINKIRVKNKTPVKGLWIAGDYTDTGYPSTLEGAVRSGLRCAESIIRETKSK